MVAVVGAGAVVGLLWFYLLYLVVVAFVASVAVYAITRHRFTSVRVAAFSAGGTFAAAALMSAAAFTVAMHTM